MMRSTTKNKKRAKGIKTGPLWAALFWLVLWQGASMVLNSRLLLPSPLETLAALTRLCGEEGFWAAVFFSFARIAAGFFLGTLAGAAASVAAYIFSAVRVLLSPLLFAVKATPVASFIILALVWFDSGNLAVFISFLMVMPIVYTSCLEGLCSADPLLLEMADVYHVSFFKRARAIYLPAVAPFFSSACQLGLGLAWKSGIAAEVIGLPAGSIGEGLYEAKLYFATGELFAWTVVIVLLSILFEKSVLWLLNSLEKRMGVKKGADLF